MHEIANVAAQAAFVEAHSSWAADPVHLPHIRSQTRNWLAPLALDQDTERDLVLAVNEAVSNAIEHAYTAPGPTHLVQISFWTGRHHLYLEVADHGRWRQPDPNPDHAATAS